MPCWYFEKKEIKNTPSFRDGIDSSTEARYRREGARFIIDAGTKMGLRFDTCATGVVYFHRFYMFHSFKEFHRYITAACCLFLAGKVEETPKKVKDLIKVCQALLSPQLMNVFGQDPKEEVITMERILLQTIKFDLQVEHPYSYLLKFAKIIKGDKEKIQKLVQMAWTFINDSLCTCLCLMWEPEIIGVSLMYLATRLSKFDIQDWQGKHTGSKTKWWDALVEDVTVDLMEDICHKVLDLYSPNPQSMEESPPVTPTKRARDTPPPPPPQVNKRSKQEPPADTQSGKVPQQPPPAPNKELDKNGDSRRNQQKKQEQQGVPPHPPTSTVPPQSDYNPYMSSQMYSSSFMSGEGSKSIQTLMSGGSSAEGYQQQAPPPGQYGPPPGGQYTSAPGYPQGQPAYPMHAGYPPVSSEAGYHQPYSAPSTGFGSEASSFPPAAGYQPPPHQQFNTQYQQQPPGFQPQQPNFQYQPPRTMAAQPPYQNIPPNPAPGTPTAPRAPPRQQFLTPVPTQPKTSGLATVRITGRR